MGIEDFKRNHRVGFCRRPHDFDLLPSLSAGGVRFDAPQTVYTMDYCTKPEDQGSRPWCAAYAAAGFAENIFWRKNHYRTEIDPAPLYAYAKTVDGDPNGDGTTLNAVLEALLAKGIFNPSVCRVKVVRPYMNDVKFALHSFGCILAGFDISEEWYLLNRKHQSVCQNGYAPQGGHAVLLCGYDRKGVYFQNSWGTEWGFSGFGIVSWGQLAKQMIYGACLTNCLDGMSVRSV